MEKIKTATGKEFDCDYLSQIPAPDQVYIRVCNTSIAEVARVFSNPEETVQLYCGAHYLAHYTKMLYVLVEPDAVKVCLAKE